MRLQLDQRVLGFAQLSALTSLSFSYHELNDILAQIDLGSMRYRITAEHPHVACRLRHLSADEARADFDL